MAQPYQGELDRNWSQTRGRVMDEMQTRLAAGDSYVLYDVQTYTNNLLDLAMTCGRIDWIDDLSKIYGVAARFLEVRDGHVEWHCGTPACKIWAFNPRSENVIVSSQFVYVLARAIHAIALVPSPLRTTAMASLVRNLGPVIQSHLDRWVFAPTASDKLFGTLSGCVKAPLTGHLARVRTLATFGYRGEKSYCNVVLDKDLWIIAAAGEILATDHLAPSLLHLASAERTRLTAYARAGVLMVQRHFKVLPKILRDFRGRAVDGALLDPGAWRDHPDFDRSGFSGKLDAAGADAASVAAPVVGWDISHARRLVHVLATFRDMRSATGTGFPADSFMRAVASQFVYGTFRGSRDNPTFSNFMDGSNGWYRVGYRGQRGIRPSGLSKAALTGGYASWSNFNSDVGRVIGWAWGALRKEDAGSSLNRQYYGFDTTGTSLDVLMTLPSFATSHPTRRSGACSSQGAPGLAPCQPPR